MPPSKPLPDCDGPKLECFLDDITTGNFKILGFLGAGCHSQVWKAEIYGEVYAIKIVNAPFDQSPSYLSLLSNHDLVFRFGGKGAKLHHVSLRQGPRKRGRPRASCSK